MCLSIPRDSGAVNVMQTNAIIHELRAIEKSDRNVVIANLPESSEEEAAARKKEDEKRVGKVFKGLNLEQIKPVNVIRVGFRGRYPRKVLVILNSVEERDKALLNAEKTEMPNNVWLARDQTWNQREESRLFQEEKTREEVEGGVPLRGRPRGWGKGPGRPKKTGTGPDRGRGSRQDELGSRKRHRSGEEDNVKWSRTGERKGKR